MRVVEPCAEFSGVKDVRVQGAIGVVEFNSIRDVEALKRRFVAAGVFVRPFRNIVYLTPAFTISEGDLKRLTDAVEAVLRTSTREPRRA